MQSACSRHIPKMPPRSIWRRTNWSPTGSRFGLLPLSATPAWTTPTGKIQAQLGDKLSVEPNLLLVRYIKYAAYIWKNKKNICKLLFHRQILTQYCRGYIRLHQSATLLNISPQKSAHFCPLLTTSFSLQRFTADFRDLTSWVTEMKALINADELANDVAGAEALLDRHQEHKVKSLITHRVHQIDHNFILLKTFISHVTRSNVT